MSAASEYVSAVLTPTLQPALIALCRARPPDPITWLAEYLLANKPQPPLFSVTEAFKEAAIRVFMMADDDGSGSLSFNEVKVIAERQQEAKQILRHLDTDKDGTISLQEWVTFFMALFSDARPVAEFLLEKAAFLIFERDFMLTCRMLFEEFDRDKSMTLDLAEVQMAIGDDEQGAEFMKFADASGDNALGVDEWMTFFFNFWRANPQVARANVGFLMGQAAALRMMPPMPPSEADRKLAEAISSEEGRAELKALFSTLDKDGDGKVTKKEWGKALSKNKDLVSKFFGGQTLKEIGKQFARIDADGSGDLTWDEFVSGLASLNVAQQLAGALSTEEGKKELKALFDALDKDGDGKVTSKEWGSAISKNKEILAKFFGGASIKEIGAAFKRLDADGSKDLTWDEFVAGAMALAAQ